MIVKNEEEMLPECLESVDGLVDEIILVDTGSTDRTLEIAKEFGAKIFHFPWINDFAAARNESIKHATGDYLLILDADERLYEFDRTAFDEAMKCNDFNMGLIALHQALSRTALLDDVICGDARRGSPILLPRFLKHTENFRYEGVVHEQPVFDEPFDFRIVEANIVHHGADDDWREQRAKKERNLELLLGSVDSYGDMAIYWSYLASELEGANRNEEMREAIRKGWNVVEKNISEGKFSADSAIACLYPSLLISEGKVKEGLEALSLVIGRKVPTAFINPNLLFSAAYSLSVIELPAFHRENIFGLVAEIAQLCMDLRNEAFLEELLPGVVSWKAKELLGHALLRLRRYDEALDIFLELKEEKPDLRGVDYWIVEVYLDQGSQESIQKGMEMLLPLLEKSQDPDPWILGASAFLALESTEDARMFWENAIMRYRIGFHAQHRLRMLNSIECMFRLLEGDPQSGKGVYGVLGAIVSRRPLQSNTPVPKFIIQQVLEQFIHRNRFDLIEPLLEPRAEQILPGIASVVTETAEELGIEIYDDGQRAPIFIHTSNPALIKEIFSNHPNFICVDNFTYHQQLCDTLYTENEEEDDDLFDDTFSWLEDDNLWDDAALEDDIILEGIEKCLSHFIGTLVTEKKHFVCISDNNAPYFNVLAKLYPRAKLIHFISDPRTHLQNKSPESPTEAKEEVLSWLQNLSAIRAQCERLEQNYFESTESLLQKYSNEELGRLFSFLGQTWEEGVADAVEEAPFQYDWKQLSEEYLAVVDHEIGPIMKSLGFID
jgi:glycosyltransferase involved in cell wall biosynthesis